MMTWNPRANDLFLRASELRSAGERQAFLDEVCAGDATLRAEVESLLEASAQAGRFLESPALALHLIATVDDPSSERPGTVIGSYKLMEQIGEGGMGLVFVAEQQQPVRRKVALKVIKPGMDTRQVVARFEAERQALALMDHPNIAKVLDGGETACGRPYFVMELVKGVPITEYCDQNRVPIRERLELFVHVCQAVQHAHQKGIIHRDLKPSNVLVMSHDGTPVVKVIDFGVAKAIGQQLTDKTIYTQFSQMVGTPLYMSPEQAGMSGLDVDTRSDIYSLGVLLYELLTGTTPFDRERMHELSYDEMRRIIREEEPPKPSTRISTLGQVATTVSVQRQSDPKQLSRLFRGELDWIVMKALEKDRNRRYETANGLAMDVRRYLTDEPVQACPPTVAYRLKKFWQRNRGLVSATAVVFLCLVGGIVGTSWGLMLAVHAQSEADEKADAADQARRAADQARRAEELQRELAQKEKTRAEENLKQARLAVDKLFTRVAENLDNKPHMEHIRRALLVDALEFYKVFLAQKATEPEMRHETARAYLRVGHIQRMLGRGPEAEEAMRQAVALLKKLADEVPGVPVYREDLAQSRESLAFRLFWANKHEENVELRREVLADWQKLTVDFPTVPFYQRRVAHAHTDLGNALKDSLGRLAEAEQHFRKALDVWKKLATDFPKEPVDHFGVSHSRLWLGGLLAQTGRLVEAAEQLEQAVALRERLVAQFPDAVNLKKDLGYAQGSLADLFQRTGKHHQAVQTYRRAAALREKVQDDFPHDAENRRELSWMYDGLGGALQALGRTQEAEDAFRQALAHAKKLVADHPGVPPYPYGLACCYYDLGLFLHDTNRPEDAADTFRQVRLLFETNAPSPQDAEFQGLLAWFLATCPAPQFRDANRAIEAAKQSLQRGHPNSYVRAWKALGIAQYRAGSWQAAEEALKKAIELTHDGDGEERSFLAMVHWQRGNKIEARRCYQKAVDWMQKHKPGDAELRRFRAEAAMVLGMKK